MSTTISSMSTTISTVIDDVTSMSTSISSINGGKGIKYFHANSILIDSSATGKNSIAIGGNASATAENAVALGTNAVADQANTVSFGNATDKLRITNIANGIDDSDVATVGQLKETSLYKEGTNGLPKTAVTFDTKADGSTDYSSITLGGQNGTAIHNVADGVAPTDLANKEQLDALSSQIAHVAVGDDPMFAADGNRATEAAVASGTHATASGAGAQATGANSVAQGAGALASGVGAVAIGAGSHATADDSVALGASSVADRSNTVSVGSVGNERQITNVAKGEQGTDLVNVNQLNDAVAQSNSYTDSVVNGMQGAVTDVGRNAYSGIAAATALAMIPNIDQDKTVSLGVGGATYQGYAAAAVALNLRVTQNLVLKAGAGSTRNGTVYGANASYRW
ncbi:YadA family autotransporter adhesin [Caballeronia fortuita]|uniref:YadA family autotransporter adhesin n=1 Tax=Caballeronia fortuita TaxID=1777138 RepID=UPI001FC97797|nr:YadA-like family protein [Caballeronia fortuita]